MRRPLCLHTSTVTEQLQHTVQHAPEGSAFANGRARYGKLWCPGRTPGDSDGRVDAFA